MVIVSPIRRPLQVLPGFNSGSTANELCDFEQIA